MPQVPDWAEFEALLDRVAALEGAPPPDPDPPPPDPPPDPDPRTRRLLTTGDLSYLGLFRFPHGSTLAGLGARLGFSSAAFTIRRVNGEVRVFVTGSVTGDPNGNKDAVYEFAAVDPVIAPMTDTPRCDLVRNWGDAPYGDRLVSEDDHVVNSTVRGLLWLDDRLWWSYGHTYNVAGFQNRSIGATTLHDDGTVQVHGPWRTNEAANRTKGSLVEIPASFHPFVEGRSFGCVAPTTNGNASANWGATLLAFHSIDPGTPPSIPGGNDVALDATRVLLHDITHKQARPDSDYIACGWNVLYDCSQGTYTNPGQGLFTNVDAFSSAAWIETDTVHGVLFFGSVIGVVPGYVYPTDDRPHHWYGPNTCCHGHNGQPRFGGIGQKTSSMVPKLAIYDPARLAQVAAGTVEPWQPPDVLTDLGPLIPSMPVPERSPDNISGAVFDPVDRRLYLCEKAADLGTSGRESQPVIHVFEVTA